VNGHVLSFSFALPPAGVWRGSKTQIMPFHGMVRKQDESLAQWANCVYFWQHVFEYRVFILIEGVKP
jgi:hypothetical protein